jgi:hypothetical protein
MKLWKASVNSSLKCLMKAKQKREHTKHIEVTCKRLQLTYHSACFVERRFLKVYKGISYD